MTGHTDLGTSLERRARDATTIQRKDLADQDNQLNYYAEKLDCEIDSWDLSAALENGDNVIIVDTRSPEAFRREHIVDAINLPHRSMNPKTTVHLDGNALLVTYCDGIGCNASTKGAYNLVELDFRVNELIGGLTWWKRDGYETVRNADPDTCDTSV